MNRKLRMYMYSSHLLPWNIESSELLFGFVVVDDNLRRHSFLADVLLQNTLETTRTFAQVLFGLRVLLMVLKKEGIIIMPTMLLSEILSRTRKTCDSDSLFEGTFVSKLLLVDHPLQRSITRNNMLLFTAFLFTAEVIILAVYPWNWYVGWIG